MNKIGEGYKETIIGFHDGVGGYALVQSTPETRAQMKGDGSIEVFDCPEVERLPPGFFKAEINCAWESYCGSSEQYFCIELYEAESVDFSLTVNSGGGHELIKFGEEVYRER